MWILCQNHRVLTGSENRIACWNSRCYHKQVDSTSIVGRGISHGGTSVVCRAIMGSHEQLVSFINQFADSNAVKKSKLERGGRRIL